MITKEEEKQARERAGELIRRAGIRFTQKELERMDVADFGLSDLEREGAQILSLFDTERVACRVIALFPGQTEPEHWHEGIGGSEGKEETLRVIAGTLRVCVEGEANLDPSCIPEGKEQYYTCRHEILLRESENLTLYPGQKHWFQAACGDCVFYTMSTTASDNRDPFSDPGVVRKTVVR